MTDISLRYAGVNFLYPELAQAVFQSITNRVDEIVAAADAGEPPVAVLIRDLGDLIHEGYYWRMVEREIAGILAPHFERVGRKPVAINLLRSGVCYRRIHAGYPRLA